MRNRGLILFISLGLVLMFSYTAASGGESNLTIVSGSDLDQADNAALRTSKKFVELQDETGGEAQRGNINIDGNALLNSIGVGTSTLTSVLEVKSLNAPVAVLHGSSTAWVTMDFVRDSIDGVKKGSIGLTHTSFFGGNGMVIGTFNGEEWTNPLVLENGAPTGALYVDVNGNVGIGTTSPSTALEVTATDAPVVIINGKDSTWVTTDFQRNGEVRGNIGISPVDLFGGDALIIGSFDGDEFTDPLVIENSAPTGALYVNAEGHVGVGTVEPAEQLSVDGNLSVSGAITEGSSMVLKNDIGFVSKEEAMAALYELKPAKYKYKSDSSMEEYLGFIAEDVPGLVATADRKRLRTMDIVAVLTKVVQEQQRVIEEMSKDIEVLKSGSFAE